MPAMHMTANKPGLQFLTMPGRCYTLLPSSLQGVLQMSKKENFHSQLVKMSSPSAVFAEVRHISGLMEGVIDLDRLEMVFKHTCELYDGSYSGYRPCNTLYHDLRHTTDVFLALARLLHGAYSEGIRFAPGEATIALISTLMHDTGYIQKSSDRTGTGGKYTLTHVARSIDFVSDFFPAHGFTSEETILCKNFIHGTSINIDLNQTGFPTPSALMLAKMIGTADLLGQLADRIYLEKLLFLYREFREANITSYSSEFELLNSTIGFYDLMESRLFNTLDNVQQHMYSHFRSRWGIDRNLYEDAIGKNLTYLRSLLKQHSKDYRSNLKREGIVAKLVAIENTGKATD